MSDHPPTAAGSPRSTSTKVPLIGRAIFNPWVNIPVSIVFTLGCGAMTVWFVSLLLEALNAPTYPDQGLDITGAVIGVVVMVLITIALVVVTIALIVWWKRVGTDWLYKSGDQDTTGEHTTP